LSAPLPLGAHTENVTADRGGTLVDIDAMAVAMAAWRLGAGRAHPGQPVQSGAGIRIHRKPGEPVTAGERLFTLYTDTPERLRPALTELENGFTIGTTGEFSPRPLVIDRIL
jgi:thymidine phosphorylase